jgi:N-acetylglutamate synthase
MHILKMNISDYDDVYKLWINTPGMGLNNLDDSKEGIEKYLKRNPNTCFVARNDEGLIGVIVSGHDGRRGFIHHTAVKETEQKKGVGKRLVEAALEALKNEGINKVALVVFKKNKKGNTFWEKIGFDERTDITYRNKIISSVDVERINT